jgi:hypothetical protein
VRGGVKTENGKRRVKEGKSGNIRIKRWLEKKWRRKTKSG